MTDNEVINQVAWRNIFSSERAMLILIRNLIDADQAPVILSKAEWHHCIEAMRATKDERESVPHPYDPEGRPPYGDH